MAASSIALGKMRLKGMKVDLIEGRTIRENGMSKGILLGRKNIMSIFSRVFQNKKLDRTAFQLRISLGIMRWLIYVGNVMNN